MEHIVFGPKRELYFHVHRFNRLGQREGCLIRDVSSTEGTRPRIYMEPLVGLTFVEMTTHAGPTTWAEVDRVLKKYRPLFTEAWRATKKWGRKCIAVAVTPGAESLINMVDPLSDLDAFSIESDVFTGVTFRRLRGKQVKTPTPWQEARSILRAWGSAFRAEETQEMAFVFGPSVAQGNNWLLHFLGNLDSQTASNFGLIMTHGDELSPIAHPLAWITRQTPEAMLSDLNYSIWKLYYISTPEEFQQIMLENQKREGRALEIIPLPVSYATFDQLTPLLTFLFNKWFGDTISTSGALSPAYVADLLRLAFVEGVGHPEHDFKFRLGETSA